jgi:hypothetical protein
MELPAELRIMIAKYALYLPGGLSWLWTNYRKGPRVATLVNPHSAYSTDGRKLEKVNALARVCKVLYAETKGLVLNLNVIRFSLYDSHSLRPPRRCYRDSDGSDHNLRAFGEALDFIRRFIPRSMRPKFGRVQLIDFDFGNVKHHMDQFNQILNDHRDLSVTIYNSKWKLSPLNKDDVQKLVDLEEEGEPYITEPIQMQQRIHSYMETGEKTREFVEKVSTADKNWRVFPGSISKRDTVRLAKFLTEEQKEQIKIWQRKGI